MRKLCDYVLSEGDILFGDIFENHIDVDIESPKSTNKLLVSFHYYPYFGPYAPIYQLCTTKISIFDLICTSFAP